ncbi:hypothetical protein ACJMK2_037451 [Sinanodonta woodiana]|uniref:Uncharacterized protein n=1 Tax=Sinanodonta woodiana TaxID=1069815 RepID=A0ABD3WKE9_SINWO
MICADVTECIDYVSEVFDTVLKGEELLAGLCLKSSKIGDGIETVAEIVYVEMRIVVEEKVGDEKNESRESKGGRGERIGRKETTEN